MSRSAQEVLADARACLLAFEDSHATHRTLNLSHLMHILDEGGRYQGSHDVTELVDEKTPCECHLCDWARILMDPEA